MDVQLPDGSIARFPDDMDPAQIEAALQRQFLPDEAYAPSKAEARAYEPGILERVGDTVSDAMEAVGFGQTARNAGRANRQIAASIDGAGQGLTFGTSDEIEAGLKSGLGMTGDYNQALAATRGRMDMNRALQPEAFMAGQGPGTIVSAAGAPAPLVARAASTVPAIGAAAIEGAGYAGLAGAGYANENRTVEALKAAKLGGAFGAAGGGVARALTRAKGTTNGPAPTSDDLLARADDAYGRSDAAGVIYGPDVPKAALARAQDDLSQRGYHPANEPGVAPVLGELERIGGGNVTLRGMNTARKMARNGWQAGNASNNAALEAVVRALDEAVESAPAGSVVTGNAAGGTAAIREGRDLYARGRKLAEMEGIEEAARLGQGERESAIRSGAGAMLKSSKRSRGLTPAEWEAVAKVATGSATDKVLRGVGKLSPDSPVSIATGVGSGFLMAGNPGAIALPLAGYLAKAHGRRATRKNMGTVKALMAAGGKRPVAVDPVARAQMSKLMSRGGAPYQGLVAAP